MAIFVNGSGRNEQSLLRTFHRCFLPSFGLFGQAVSEEKILKNRPIRNKNCLWWPCLLMNRYEMSNLYRGPSIDASYQISDQLALRFQRRRLKCEKLMDDAKWWQKVTLHLARWANNNPNQPDIIFVYCFHMHKLFDSINHIIDVGKYLMPFNRYQKIHYINYRVLKMNWKRRLDIKKGGFPTYSLTLVVSINILSEWVSCFLMLYLGKTKLIFNKMMMKFALYKINTLSWIFLVLAYWNNSPRIDMSPHSDTLSWFRADQSLCHFSLMLHA